MPFPAPQPARARRTGFTMMEILVTVAVLLVVGSIALPVYSTMQRRAHFAHALNSLRQTTGALMTYCSQNDQYLPAEDAKGTDTWANAARPESANAWYNALPKMMGHKGVGDYANTPRDFYTRENVLFLPGAAYPAGDGKLAQPLFAFAINTKLQRKGEDGQKQPVRLSQITSPSRTVAFLEQGIPKETKAMKQQPKYDGSCKGSAKSFVARYGGQGVLSFCDGHSEAVEGKDILTESGYFPFPQVEYIWTQKPEDDPNK
jgi:prepilin-type N-terminal cleavage/methylation domain-containing protein